MEDEQARILEALRFAIQMETDGKEYYRKASRESSNRIGKELFEWLSSEEDDHQQKFEQIYQAIRREKTWPEVDIRPRKAKELGNLFSEAMRVAETDVKIVSDELDMIAKAMEMENKTGDFYKSQGDKAVYSAEKKFYDALAAEERGHYLALVDYREYLINPAGWFSKAEHHSLNGG